jgi:hypothetical protein
MTNACLLTGAQPLACTSEASLSTTSRACLARSLGRDPAPGFFDAQGDVLQVARAENRRRLSSRLEPHHTAGVHPPASLGGLTPHPIELLGNTSVATIRVAPEPPYDQTLRRIAFQGCRPHDAARRSRAATVLSVGLPTMHCNVGQWCRGADVPSGAGGGTGLWCRKHRATDVRRQRIAELAGACGLPAAATRQNGARCSIR